MKNLLIIIICFQNRLLPMRDRFKEIEDKQVETSLTQKEKNAKKPETKDEPFYFPDGKYHTLGWADFLFK